jgi:hypothetical protein
LILVEAEVDAELLVEVLTGAGLLDEWDESRQSIAEAFGAAVRLWIAQELAKR